MSRRDYSEDYALIERWQKHGDVAARNRLVEKHRKFVYMLARKVCRRQQDLEDIATEGVLWFMRALDKFDPAKSTSLLTYASHWVREGVRRAAFTVSRVVHRPNFHRYRTTSAWKEQARAVPWTTPVYREGSRTLQEVTPDAAAAQAELELIGAAEKRELGKCLCRLTERERDVVMSHAAGETLAEIAVRYGITREAIRQTEVKAMRKLRLRLTEAL